MTMEYNIWNNIPKSNMFTDYLLGENQNFICHVINCSSLAYKRNTATALIIVMKKHSRNAIIVIIFYTGMLQLLLCLYSKNVFKVLTQLYNYNQLEQPSSYVNNLQEFICGKLNPKLVSLTDLYCIIITKKKCCTIFSNAWTLCNKIKSLIILKILR